jgi:hypothetical protein
VVQESQAIFSPSPPNFSEYNLAKEIACIIPKAFPSNSKFWKNCLADISPDDPRALMQHLRNFQKYFSSRAKIS